MRRLFALVALLGLASPGIAQESPAPTRTRTATLRLGTFVPAGGDLGGFRSGFDGEVALSFTLRPHLVGELAVGRFRTETYSDAWTQREGEEIKNEALELTTLTATLKVVASVARADLYALLGGGGCNAEYRYTFSYWDPGFYGTDPPFDVTDTVSEYALLLHVGGGAAVAIDAVRIGVEARYTFVKLGLPRGMEDGPGLRLFGSLGYAF